MVVALGSRSRVDCLAKAPAAISWGSNLKVPYSVCNRQVVALVLSHPQAWEDSDRLPEVACSGNLPQVVASLVLDSSR